MNQQAQSCSHKNRRSRSNCTQNLPQPGKQKGNKSRIQETEQKKSEFRVGAYLQDKHDEDKYTKMNQKTRVPSTTNNEHPKRPTSSQKKQNTVHNHPQIQSYRSLLPQYLRIKFPKSLQNLHKLVTNIDKYLYETLNHQKQLRDNFINIQLYLKLKENIQIRQIELLEINFVFFEFYVFFRDPLRNLIVGVQKMGGRVQGLATRQQAIRKKLYDVYMGMIRDGKEIQQIPTRQFHTKRTQEFYPPKRFRNLTNLPENQPHQPLKQQFINKILQQVCLKQQEQKSISEISVSPQLPINQLHRLRQALKQIYQEKQVSNIFKATLISILDEKTDIQLPSIMKGLEMIIQDDEQVQQIKVGDRIVVSFGLRGGYRYLYPYDEQE